MKEYQIDIGSLLKMPKKHFFWLLNMLPRVRAEQNLHLLKALIASQSTQEGFEKIAKELEEERGTIYLRTQQVSVAPTFKVEDENALDPQFDREGLRALKLKHGA